MGCLPVPGKSRQKDCADMTETPETPESAAPETVVPESAPRELTPAAQRALAEARARRAEIDAKAMAHSDEKNGRGGLDPARYGDWEIKGLAADF